MSLEGGAALIWCPFPDEEAAAGAIATLLAERLVACGNSLPGMRSLFAWQGEREDSAECGVLLKTCAALLEAAMTRLEDLHPYETPAIMGWPVFSGAGTLRWLDQETTANC